MIGRFFFTGLLVIGFSVSSQASDAEIDACSTASDKMLCVAKVFNRKFDLLTAAVQVIDITYFDEPNCTVSWGNGSIAVQSAGNPAALENVCAGVAQQAKNVTSGNSTIESVMVGNGSCVAGLNINRQDSSALIADCVRRLRSF